MVQYLRGSGVDGAAFYQHDALNLIIIVGLCLIVVAIVTFTSNNENSNDDGSNAGTGRSEVVDGAQQLDDLEAGNLSGPNHILTPPTPPTGIDAIPHNVPHKQQKKRVYYSRAHDEIEENKVVYVHIDVEDGGRRCGLIQISVVIMDCDREVIAENNWYIRPPDNAVWDPVCIATHHLTKDDPRIAGAKDILYVWNEFKNFVEDYIQGDKVGMLLAWNGRGSDCTKLFEITELKHRGVLMMPRGLKYFCDPMHVISHYKSCVLNESKRKSNIVGYSLSVVYYT